MKAITRTLVSFAALLIVSGCSSVGEVQIERQLDTKIDHGAVASLSVQPDKSVERSEAVTKAVQRLRGQLFGRLVSDGVFRQVVHPGDAARYDINVELLAAKEVSQGARIFWGVMAGSNELAVRVNVHDSDTKTVLTSFTAKGTSASHPFSSENDMDDAIREVVDEVIVALRK